MQIINEKRGNLHRACALNYYNSLLLGHNATCHPEMPLYECTGNEAISQRLLHKCFDQGYSYVDHNISSLLVYLKRECEVIGILVHTGIFRN